MHILGLMISYINNNTKATNETVEAQRQKIEQGAKEKKYVVKTLWYL